MKKVLVITRHAIANYGSLLQAIATQRVIESAGYDCKILDYIRTDEYKNNGLITGGKKKNYVKKFPPLILLYYLARIGEYSSASSKFGRMRKELLPMTELIHDFNNVPEADIYMTGSDQVWGPLMNHEYDMNYFLEAIPDDKKKVSYAASFGKMEISENDKERIISALKRYDSITVRERHAVDFLSSNGISSQQVLDPTLLLSGDDWRKLFNTQKRADSGKYVLVYQIHGNKKLCEYAKNVSEQLGLPLIRVAAMRHQKKWGGDFVETPDLRTFIEYIDNAAFLVTDSFHGTAFSINLNTPFTTLMPETGTSSRNISLLELTGLTDWIAKDINDFHMLNKQIDFDKINNVLLEERKKSLDVLNSILK